MLRSSLWLRPRELVQAKGYILPYIPRLVLILIQNILRLSGTPPPSTQHHIGSGRTDFKIYNYSLDCLDTSLKAWPKSLLDLDLEPSSPLCATWLEQPLALSCCLAALAVTWSRRWGRETTPGAGGGASQQSPLAIRPCQQEENLDFNWFELQLQLSVTVREGLKKNAFCG